jgi:dCTP deaminase
VIFLAAEDVCSISYADRNGKYQKQQGIAMPRI